MKKEVMADEVIGAVINEYGKIVRAGGEEIQFSAPIFTPPQENATAPQTEDVSVSFRVVSEPKKSAEKEVSGISKLELEKIKEEMGL